MTRSWDTLLPRIERVLERLEEALSHTTRAPAGADAEKALAFRAPAGAPGLTITGRVP